MAKSEFIALASSLGKLSRNEIFNLHHKEIKNVERKLKVCSWKELILSLFLTGVYPGALSFLFISAFSTHKQFGIIDVNEAEQRETKDVTTHVKHIRRISLTLFGWRWKFQCDLWWMDELVAKMREVFVCGIERKYKHSHGAE